MKLKSAKVLSSTLCLLCFVSMASARAVPTQGAVPPALARYRNALSQPFAYSPFLSALNGALLERNAEIGEVGPAGVPGGMLRDSRTFLSSSFPTGSALQTERDLLATAAGAHFDVRCATWWSNRYTRPLRSACDKVSGSAGPLSAKAIDKWSSAVTGGAIDTGIDQRFELNARTSSVLTIAVKGILHLSEPISNGVISGAIPVKFLSGSAPEDKLSIRSAYESNGVVGVRIPLEDKGGYVYLFTGDLASLQAFEDAMPMTWSTIRSSFRKRAVRINAGFSVSSTLYYHLMPGQKLALPGIGGMGEFGAVQRVSISAQGRVLRINAVQSFASENPVCCDDYIGILPTPHLDFDLTRQFVALIQLKDDSIPFVINS